MQNSKERSVSRILLKFTQLDIRDQSKFISCMNEFLLASHKTRKGFVEQWESECSSQQPTPNENNHANHRN